LSSFQNNGEIGNKKENKGEKEVQGKIERRKSLEMVGGKGNQFRYGMNDILKRE
jgi:hypothetical protein